MEKRNIYPPFVVAMILALGAVVILKLALTTPEPAYRCPYHKIPFICTDCGSLQKIEFEDLRKMNPPKPNTRFHLTCPACRKKTSVPAVECPNCQTLFLIKFDPTETKLLDDTCPKCGQSYAEAWKQKYTKQKSN